MGRVKYYGTGAERQAAYRRRLRDTTAQVDRQALARLQARHDALHQAIAVAARQGDALARSVTSASIGRLLDNLMALFHRRAAALTERQTGSIIE
ncbi:MAG: hypothetical protein ACYDBB_10575 [Armatimonadota bacterium]